MPPAFESFCLALLAYGEGDLAHASALAGEAAAREPGSLLFGEAARWLDGSGIEGAGVYEHGGAFAAFARGGGNPALYAATSERLRRVYAEYDSLVLLDVGVGDGAALLPALSERVTHVDLVEPSRSLLSATVAALTARSIFHRAFCMTVEEFSAAAPPGGRWDVAQATFSLQSIPAEHRAGPLAWLAERAGRLLLVEFDVPLFEELDAPARVKYVVERYERGLAEYADDRELVAQGFLMPVLFGSFDRTTARTNYEQPIAAWADELRAAGFAQTRSERLHRYWWADAWLVDAQAG
jgi:hypothetical protein